jgi:hypothetical protein
VRLSSAWYRRTGSQDGPETLACQVNKYEKAVGRPPGIRLAAAAFDFIRAGRRESDAPGEERI